MMVKKIFKKKKILKPGIVDQNNKRIESLVSSSSSDTITINFTTMSLEMVYNHYKEFIQISNIHLQGS